MPGAEERRLLRLRMAAAVWSCDPELGLRDRQQPAPGQYRYLRFAWKAASEKTTGMSLLLGRAWPGGGVEVTIGDVKWTEGVVVEKSLTGKPPTEWREETIDLWETTKGKPPRIQALSLRDTGGGAMFDRIILTRNPPDKSLPASPGK